MAVIGFSFSGHIALVTTHINYCSIILANVPKFVTDKPQRVLNAASCVASSTKKSDGGLSQWLHDELHWLDVLE